MSNRLIVKSFEQLVKQIEAEILNSRMEGDEKEMKKHTFRLRSIKKALSVIKKITEPIEDVSQLEGMDDIGAGTLDRVKQILETGTLKELKHKYTDEKKKKIEGIQSLEEVIGVGAAMAKKFVTEHGITSVAQLKKAVRKGEIHVSHTIELGLKYYGKVKGAIPRSEIKKIEKYLRRQAKEIDPQLDIIICGSYRRGKPTSGDIDLLVHHPDIIEAADIKAQGAHSYLSLFVDLLTDRHFILDNMTDKNYRTKYMGFCQLGENPVRRIDIRYIAMESLPTATLYFTGPYELNTIMRSRAKKASMILNEYGLYEVDGETKTQIPIHSEEEVFETLGMEYLSPTEREDYSG